MKTKLMISVLMLCSSLSFAGDLSTAPATTAPLPQKKMMKVRAPAPDSKLQHPDDGTALGGLGTGGTGTANPKKMVRTGVREGK